MVSADCWGVWRGQDRRGRVIGTFKGAEIEIMRMTGDLSPRGTAVDSVLFWSGTLIRPEPIIAGNECLKPSHPTEIAQPLLHRLLFEVSCAHDRRRLSQAAIDYAEDAERSTHPGTASGMNWNQLSLGGKVQGGLQRAPAERVGFAADAAKRMQKLEKTFSLNESRLLQAMILEEKTRNAVAKLFDCRAHIAEQKAGRVLRRLADIYDQDISRPERARQL